MVNTLQPEISKQEVRAGILSIEEQMRQMPGVMLNDCFPLKHSFADGMYVREITVPAGMLIVTKTHKFAHPVFLLQGEVSVLDTTGVKRIKAPCSFITPAGTKRICFTHSDVVWTTVHKTDKTNLEQIEEDIISKDIAEVEYSETDLINFVNTANKGE
jgi:hypothetical protein